MGSRGQSGRDKDAGDIVKDYNLDSIGENKGKILAFFRDLDGTDEDGVVDRFREEATDLAEDLADSMVYRDDDAREEFNRLRRELGSTTYTLSDEDRSNIPDFQRYIRSGENFLKIGKRGLPIDSAYAELAERFPDRFPPLITNPADQLQHINRVLGDLRKSRVVAASEEDKEAAAPYIYDALARAYNEIRRRKGLSPLRFGDYVGKSSGTYGGGSRYSGFDDDDELPFF